MRNLLIILNVLIAIFALVVMQLTSASLSEVLWWLAGAAWGSSLTLSILLPRGIQKSCSLVEIAPPHTFSPAQREE